MARLPRRSRTVKTVENLTHRASSRKNIPTAEYQALAKEDQDPVQVAY